MNFLIVELSPLPILILLGFKYSHQDPVLACVPPYVRDILLTDQNVSGLIPGSAMECFACGALFSDTYGQVFVTVTLLLVMFLMMTFEGEDRKLWSGPIGALE